MGVIRTMTAAIVSWLMRTVMPSFASALVPSMRRTLVMASLNQPLLPARQVQFLPDACFDELSAIFVSSSSPQTQFRWTPAPTWRARCRLSGVTSRTQIVPSGPTATPVGAQPGADTSIVSTLPSAERRLTARSP